MGILDQNLIEMNKGEIINVLKKFLPGCKEISIDPDYLEWSRLDRIFVMLMDGDIGRNSNNIYKLVSIRKANEEGMGKYLIQENQLDMSRYSRSVKVNNLISYIKEYGNI